MMAVGSVGIVFGYMMVSLCREYYQFMLAQGVCAGLSSGLLYVPALAFVSTSFPPKTRPIAIGFTTTGASTGGIVFPLIFRNLLPRIGFGWTVRTMAFIQLGLAIIALSILASAPVVRNKPRRLLDWTAFKEVPFLFLFLMFFCHFLSFFIPIFFIPSFSFAYLSPNPSLGSNLLVLANAGTFVGRLLPALAAQHIGAMNVVFITTLIVSVITFCWIAVTSTAGMIVWCLMWGIFSGTFSTIDPVVVTHPLLCGGEGLTGTRLGMAWVAAGLGVLVGTPIAGALGEKGDGFLTKGHLRREK
ncbi:hypothetical protein DV737_g3723, partial [Chaetothyriales sp. CBS 132003]